MYIKKLQYEIAPVRQQLIEHDLYKNIDSLEKIRAFMEMHVFAVWDFMSLLKGLQIGLTGTTLPWTPKGNPVSRRLINEIVLGEESDLNEMAQPMSHFEMYLEAMEQVGANTAEIKKFVVLIDQGLPVSQALNEVNICEKTRSFVNFTFDHLQTEQLHLISAVFTFGREDLIPDMFLKIVKNIETHTAVDLGKLIYYLERHIEVDSGEHGPMALQMIEELCGADEKKWQEATEASKQALEHRVQLWNQIQTSFCLQLS
jgi:hypothetical protein